MDISLRSINLNLLLCLQHLLETQSVTKAAERQCITQAAMSKALGQLRTLFRDELLVRTGNNMVLTPFAQQLLPRLKMMLADLHDLVNTSHHFDPGASQREFTLGITDYCATLLLPKLMARLAEVAPGVSINVISVDRVGQIAPFSQDLFELAIGKLTYLDPRLCMQKLFEDELVCVVHPEHALAQLETLTLKGYMEWPHVAVYRGRGQGELPLVEQYLEATGHQRDIKIRLPYMEPIFLLIEQSSELVATVPSQVAELYRSQYRFCVRPIPFRAPKMEYGVLWHPKYQKDKGLAWLREQIKAELFSNPIKC